MVKSPLAGIDVNLLVTVDALLRTQSVSGAARAIGLSESATSHALARAREMFGDPLLLRVGRRMTMTERAKEIATPLRDAVDLLAKATASPHAFNPADEVRSVRMAASDFGHAAIGPILYRALEREAPRVDLIVLPTAPGSLAELAAGHVDLVLSQASEVRGLRSRALFEEPFVCVARKGHPILREKPSAARYASFPHVLLSPGGRLPGAVDRALAKRRLKRRVAYVSPTLLAAAKVVATTDLLLTCGVRSAELIAPSFGVVAFAPPIPLPPFVQGMFWHERHEHDRFLLWLRQKIIDLTAR
jgi:DNA-binding transcriptional LysR family regulator